MSGSGKTTITAGLIAALAARGLKVAPFKVGPDYIDPTYHTLAAGRPCHNLDAWMLEPTQVAALFARQTAQADIALIEGVMGLFDGVAGHDDTGSAAHIARLTNTPVLLVLDARAMARTAAALVLGLCEFDPQVRIAGVILNRVGSERHAALIQAAVKQRLDVPIVGYVPRSEALHLPERHLGLVPTTEPGRWPAWLESAQRQMETTVDIDRVLAIAQSAPPLERHHDEMNFAFSAAASTNREAPTIAVARDEAFSFLYTDNLDLLQAAGAKLAFFSPLHDSALPADTGALYLCGGFPELYGAALAQNAPLRAAIRRAGAAGLPIYAECGGFMYLTESIVDQQGDVHPMVGLLPGHSTMTGRLTMGYRTLRAASDSWLWRAGEEARGHEFHYSNWTPPTSVTPAYELLPGAFQSESRADGVCSGSLVASYVHLFFRAAPWLVERFVAAARDARPVISDAV
jgi:cobyrinic acid a,c-diamide synthase